MFRKISAYLLIAAILFGGIADPLSSRKASAAEESAGSADEAQEHWAVQELERWKSYGIVNGYPDGSVKPDKEITRAEFVVMLDRVFNFGKPSEAKFKDVPDTAYYGEAISRAHAAGIINGTGNGLFMPDRPISREEAAKMIAIAFDLALGSPAGSNLADSSEISTWASPYVNDLVNQGYLTGRGNNRFEPRAKMTRAEMVKLLDNVVDQLVGTQGLSGTTVKGNVVVNKAPVNLKDLVIEGDLLLAPGVSAGDVVLDNVTVRGKLLIQGSSSGGIAINNSRLGVVKVTGAGTKLKLASVQIGQLIVVPSASDSVIQQDEATSIDTMDNRASNVVFEQMASGGDGVAPNPNNVSSSEGRSDPTPSPTPTPLVSKLSALAFGNAGQEAAGNLTTTGSGGVTEIETLVGQLQDAYTVRYMEGTGASITFALQNLEPNKPVTLEMEEIHQRNPEAFAYTVLANGEEVYFRTYREASAGPNHYFIEVGASIVGNASTLTLTLRNESASRVNLSRVWAYSDFADLLADEEIYRPMTVGLFKPSIKWNDYTSDLALLNGIKATYADYEMYRISVVFDVLYMHWSKEEMKRRLDYLTQLSADSGLAIHLSVDAWWDGTPTGPDGLGGYWRDLPYQQIVYDPLNTDGRGNWKLSTPNVWGNTPWLTMNNAHYNEVREDKIRNVTSYLSQRTGEMQANGIELPPVVVFTENEPWYWPYFAFNKSPRGAGDFGPEVIAAAAADNVDLDPTNGLSVEELRWLAKNMTDYISNTAQAMAEGYGYNAIVVDNGQITYPDNQLVENAFTHMFPYPKFPGLEERQALWESHMVEDIRFGGEWEDDLDDRYLSYISARGKFADVNAERSAMQDFHFLPQAYAYGADHATIYNYYGGDESIIRANDDEMNSLYVTPSYGKTIVDYNFADEQSLTPNATLVETEHVKRSPLLEKYVASADTADANGGSLTFKADNQGVPLMNGLLVDLTGRNLQYLCNACKIEVWAGPALDELTLADTVYNFKSLANVVVKDQIDPASSIAYVRIRLYSPSVASLDNWVVLSSVKISAALGEDSGHKNGFQYTHKQLRERNLWVTYRADIERLLGKYEEQVGQNSTYQTIEEQYAKGYYGAAYRALLAAMSQLLPAKFVVKGSGPLGDYPLSMHVGNPNVNVRTTLYEFGDSFTVGFVSDVATSVTLTLASASSAYYKAVDLGDGVYEIAPATAGDIGAVASSGGQAVFALTSSATPIKQYPSAFEARFYGAKAPAGHIYIQSQDPEIGEYVNAIDLKLAEDATIVRGPEGTPDEQLQAIPAGMLDHGDLLLLTMNGQNEIVSIKAYYGTVYGTITAIEPVSVTGELRNAFMEFRDEDNQDYSFELGQDSQFKSPNATGSSLFTARIDDWGFKVGDQVTLRYSPYVTSGREKRVLEISETYDSLLFENFEDASETWRSRAYSVQNVLETRLDGNIQDRVLRPNSTANPGIVTWRFDSDTPFTLAAIQYSGRAILGTTVEWEISATGLDGSWQKVGEIENNSDNNNYNQLRDIKLDVAGLNTDTLYVRVVMVTSNSDTWASLNSMKFMKWQAGARSLESALLAMDGAVVFEGQDVPLTLSASYDNGDNVNLDDAKVVYVLEDDGILSQSATGVKAVQPGTSTVQAFLSVKGHVVASNTLSVTVAANVLDRIELSSGDEIVGLHETLDVDVTAYNDLDYEMLGSLYETTYASSNTAVATVSASGTVTAVAYGTAVITVDVTFNGVSLSESFIVSVAQPVALVDEDFQGLPEGAVTAETIGAHEVLNLQNEMLFSSLPDLGLTGTSDGVGGKQDGYVVYKLDSTDSGGFKKLEFLYSGRTLYIDDNQIAAIRFYAGTSENDLTLVGDLPTSAPGNYETIRTLDLTNVAKDQTTLYLKIEIHAVAYTWGFLNSVKVIDYATGD